MERKTYLIKVLTPLHVGAGQGLGHVDLPVVREAHTNFPYVPGTAIKGAIREYWIRHVAEKKGEKPSEVDKQVVENKNDKDIQFLVKVFGSAGKEQSRKSLREARVDICLPMPKFCSFLSSL